jgi:hypothetical protein
MDWVAATMSSNNTNDEHGAVVGVDGPKGEYFDIWNRKGED